MDKKDLDSIKLGGPAFTKKWWDAHKGVLMKDSGVGKLLDTWAGYCPKDPELMDDEVELQVAKDTCEKLIVALTKAKQSCGPLAKDSKLACERYIALIEEYHKKLLSAEADPAADAQTWKKILVAMPKAIDLMHKMEERIDAAMEKMQEVAESAQYLSERAKSRNLLSTSHGGRDDLHHALDEMKEHFTSLDRFVNREATMITRLADPVIQLEDQLRTRKYDNDLRALREMIVQAGRKEGQLRDRYTELSIEIQQAEKLILKAEKTQSQVMDALENKMVMFWDSPQGASNMAASIADVTKQLDKILALEVDKLSEDEKRKLSALARHVDNERLQIDAGLTNLGNIARQIAHETRDYVKDKGIAAKLKEVLAAHQQIAGTVKVMDAKAVKVSTLVAKM